MKNLKFRTRLIIGFSITIIFGFIIGVLAIRQINKISSDTELIYKHPLAVSNSVRDIEVDINAIHRSMKDVVLAENMEQLNAALNKVNYYDSLIYKSFHLVKERFLGEKSIVENTLHAYEDWSIIKNEVIELKKTGNDTEAINITKGKGAAQVALLFDNTKLLTDFAQSKADEFYQNTIETRDKSTTALLVIFSLLLILSIVIALIISKSIAQPIFQFISDINMIFREENLQERNFLKGSEQEILSNTAMELKIAHAKLAKFNSELEHKIETRTAELARSEEKLRILNNSLEDKVNDRTKELMHSLDREKESSELKTKFISIASHEFRTPLTVINTCTSLIEKKINTEQQESTKKSINRIRSSVARLTKILNDFLTLGRISDDKLEIVRKPHNIKELVGGIIDEMEELTNSGQVIKYSHKGMVDVFVDENLLGGVIVNLLSNAIKYSEEDIELTTKVGELDLTISVKDTGMGIPKEDQKMIFTGFFRAGNTEGISGTGLGLNIVKQYVSLLGGTIDFTSVEGTGTTFTVHYPL